MGSCYSGDQIAEDLVHTDVTTCNTEEPRQKRVGTVSSILPGGAGGGSTCFTGSKPSSLTTALFETVGPHKGFLIHQ